jgi:hypothetical protein
MGHPNDSAEKQVRTLGADLPEHDRNQLLRRIDWRFLLPDPVPSVSLVIGDDALVAALRLVSDRVVDRGSAERGACDLVAITDPEPDDLRHAFHALRPGGSCYVQWRSRKRRTTSGGVRALRLAGFDCVSEFVAWRPLPRTRIWLPPHASAPRLYFLNRPLPSHKPVQRWLWQIARGMAVTAVRVGLCPTATLCVKPGDAADDAKGNGSAAGRERDGEGRVANWPLLGELRPACAGASETLSYALLTLGARSIGKVVVLVFEEPDPVPRFAVKMARVPDSVAGLQREALVLRTLEGRRPGGLEGVPRVVFTRALGETFAEAQTGVSGVPLSPLVSRKNYVELANAATAWLTGLAVYSGQASTNDEWERLVEPAFLQFSRTFGQIVDDRLLGDTREALLGLRGLASVCEQRDFAPWNVFLQPDGRLAVLDWESAELRGLPGPDLIYFLTYLGFALDGAHTPDRMIASFRGALTPDSPHGGVQRDCLSRYCAETGLTANHLRSIRLYTWIVHSRSEYSRLVADHGQPPSPALLRASVFYRLWLEELSCRPS